MTYEEFKDLALALPGVEEGFSHGDPSFKLRGHFFARLRKDGDLVLPVDLDEREILCEAEPETFRFTEHYRSSPYVLARLASVHPGTVARLLEQGWRTRALRKDVATYDAARSAGVGAIAVG